MIDGFRNAGRPRCGRAIVILAVLFNGAAALGQPGATQPASGPASQPARPSHEDMVAQIAKEPLAKEQYRSSAGKPLTEEQVADVEKANALLASAEKSKAAGDYKAAAEPCEKALAAYRQLLGDTNHRTVSAAILSRTITQILGMSSENQKKLAEAEKSQTAAEAATEKGQYKDAVKAGQQALETRERLLGKEDPEVGITLRVLGNAQLEAGQPAQAEESLTRALKISEAAFGNDHPRTALVLDRLGWLRINQSKAEEAMQALSRAVRIFFTSSGETLDLAEALDNAGTALMYMRDADRALRYKLRAFVIREKLAGPDAKETGVSLSNLAWLYSQNNMADKEEIVSLRKRALPIFQKSLGPDHPWTFLEMSNLAREYTLQGKYDDALKLFKEMIAYDKEHADTVGGGAVEHLIGLGGLYLTAGQREEAMKTLQEASACAASLEAKGDFAAAINQADTLATLYQGWRLFGEAAKVDEKSREWAKKSGQKADDAAVQRSARLGSTYNELGRYEDAVRVLQDAIHEGDSAYGEDSTKIISPLLTLSRAYQGLGKLDEAEKACDRAVKISESKTGSRSRALAYASMNLGRIQLAQQRLDLAKFSLEEARKILEQEDNRRMDPAGYIEVLQSYAACLAAAGNHTEALELCRQALAEARLVGERMKNINTDSLLITAIKKVMDVLKTDLPGSQKDYDSLKAELKKLLDDLRAAQALSAEQSRWLQELGD